MSMFSGQAFQSQELQDMTKQNKGLIKSTSIRGTMTINNRTNLPQNTKLFASVMFNKDSTKNGVTMNSMIADYDFNYTDYDVMNIAVVLPQEALNAREIAVNQ